MKRTITGGALAALLLAACQTAQTQNQPQIIVVPVDEMSSAPAAPGPATVPPPTPEASPVEMVKRTAPVAPAHERLSYNSCNVDGPYVAITFDDGPHADLTPKLLDMLKARGIKATFYVVGRNAAEYPDIVKRMVAEGHEVGNHSWSHPALNSLGAESVRSQLEKTSDAIAKATGQRPATLRPPYGATNSRLNRRFADQFGMKVVLWSVDPLDWKYRNARRVTDQIVQNTRPGAIILAHDIHASTVAAMPETLDTLLGKGYKFVTVSELIAMDRPPELVKTGEPPGTPPAPY